MEFMLWYRLYLEFFSDKIERIKYICLSEGMKKLGRKKLVLNFFNFGDSHEKDERYINNAELNRAVMKHPCQ